MRVLLAIISVATTLLLGAVALNAQRSTATDASTASQLDVVDGVLQSVTAASAGPLVYLAAFAFLAVGFAFLLVAARAGGPS